MHALARASGLYARLFGESLRIRQRLAESDPANAAWQRDLSVSHYKLAMFAQKSGDEAGCVNELRECLRVLDQMRRRNLHFDPQMAQDLSATRSEVWKLTQSRHHAPA